MIPRGKGYLVLRHIFEQLYVIFVIVFSVFFWNDPGRFFRVLVVSGVTGGVHFRWNFGKKYVFFGKGGTIDFKRPYNDFAVFSSSATSRKPAKMRKKHTRKFIVF